MKSFPRFHPPNSSDEYYFCAECGGRFYYTHLDCRGLCGQCRNEAIADQIEEEEKDRKLRGEDGSD